MQHILSEGMPMLGSCTCRSDTTWQLYNMNCQNLASVFKGEGVKLAHSLTGCLVFGSILCLQQWKLIFLGNPTKLRNTERVSRPGPRMSSWLLNALTTTLPYIRYVLVVSPPLLFGAPRCIILVIKHISSGSVCAISPLPTSWTST